MEEIGEEMGRKWGTGRPRLEIFRPGGCPGRYVAMLVVLSTESRKARNHLTGDDAKLEWWQIDNHLLGFGFAPSESEAAEQALACADRGTLARQNITVWYDRLWRKYRFFRRSTRNGETYCPTGRVFQAQTLQEFIGQR